MEIIFSNRAKQDLVDTTNYLEDQQSGLGNKFVDAIGKSLALVRLHPGAAVRHKKGYEFYL